MRMRIVHEAVNGDECLILLYKHYRNNTYLLPLHLKLQYNAKLAVSIFLETFVKTILYKFHVQGIVYKSSSVHCYYVNLIKYSHDTF